MAERKDWPFIRQAYIVKGWTAQQCADHFNIDPTTVKKRASKEGWTKERNHGATLTTQGVADEIRGAIAIKNASHIAETEADVELTMMVREKIKDAFAAAGTNPRDLRSLLEIMRLYAESRNRVFVTNREVRGLRSGQASEGDTTDALTRVEWDDADPAAESA